MDRPVSPTALKRKYCQKQGRFRFNFVIFIKMMQIRENDEVKGRMKNGGMEKRDGYQSTPLFAADNYFTAVSFACPEVVMLSIFIRTSMMSMHPKAGNTGSPDTAS